MPREKGTPKTGGRKKGTENRITTELKEWISDLIDDNREQLMHDLTQLDPKERWQVLGRLMDYVLPKAVPKPEEPPKQSLYDRPKIIFCDTTKKD